MDMYNLYWSELIKMVQKTLNPQEILVTIKRPCRSKIRREFKLRSPVVHLLTATEGLLTRDSWGAFSFVDAIVYETPMFKGETQ